MTKIEAVVQREGTHGSPTSPLLPTKENSSCGSRRAKPGSAGNRARTRDRVEQAKARRRNR